MTMSASELEVIRNTIRNLKGEGNTVEGIKLMLNDHGMRIWLDTWVIGALECLLPESRDLKLAKFLSR